ncbi:DUF4258 domain-containing protein [Methanobacterium ferruginis]|uniref:DUF4258 domain-containing protein n=1 Tax=Methanobacterium ferruginis TaxID=710191 RepID=UPI00257462F3|nr:DUF4258 domain-containing protein [Methanobacterium ferruginis]BDZ68619.1 hypothetical protein GCM10025860_20670 [Methanobacterium ferruginis]
MNITPNHHSFTPKWKDLPIIASDHAADKMVKLGIRIYDIATLLEYGQPCGSRRKKGTYVICERWQGKEVKIIVAERYSGWVNDLAIIIITIIEKR